MLSLRLVALIAAPAFAQQTLPGTAPLTTTGDLAAQMVDGIHRSLDRATALTPTQRAERWRSSDNNARRARLRRIIGAVDDRVAKVTLRRDTAPNAVRWSVFDDFEAEGLLLEPRTEPRARIVLIPDADTTPEHLAAAVGARLAASGCQVLIPTLINRADLFSGSPALNLFTNQPHREWLYRMAFESGRHVIGYEVQQTLAAIDWFTAQNTPHIPTLMAGHGQGALTAMLAAALDDRISATLASGYFSARESLWSEPIDRDLWGILNEFGDAEIAAMIAPRRLIIEAAEGPAYSGPPAERPGRKGATPNGRLATPPLSEVRAEFERARQYHPASTNLQLIVSRSGDGPPASTVALQALLGSVAPSMVVVPPITDPNPRQQRLLNALIHHTQRIIAASPARRAKLWADPAQLESLRTRVWEEMIGRLPDPSLPPNPRTRLLYDQPAFRGYEVVLDVWPDVFASGILLVPKTIRPGEHRPVVVCQHGLEGRPNELADPNIDSHYYHRLAVRLAEAGFVTFSPQNPYIGEDRFRLIQRKAHPLQLSLFSFIIGQHQRITEWLASLDFVDPTRIGFYGLSYGGKTAMRVPPFVPRYALSICSGDFNEWVWKTTTLDAPLSYMFTREYDMYEFNLANIANYAELARLIAPRPFMVERGHFDGVGLDEWVAFEFAKVRRHYDVDLNLPGRTEIEFFNGPHTIHAQGTLRFLRRHLKWPE